MTAGDVLTDPDSPLRDRLRKITTDAEEQKAVEDALDVLDAMDAEKVAARMIRVGAGLQVPASKVDRVIEKLTVVHDRLGAELLRARS